jgi:hypothetical protein
MPDGFENSGQLIELRPAEGFQVPALIADVGPEAPKRFFEFFTVPIRNRNTRIAYYHAISQFLDWCQRCGFCHLEDIEPITLGHTYEGEPPAITCRAIQLSGTNISGKPIRIEAARLTSKISGESVEVDIGTVAGWARPEQTHSIPPESKVTLQATFNGPKGLIAQEFINSWGQCAYFVTYNGANEEIPISEEMTRALYENFRPEPIAPRPIHKAPNRMNWNRNGTIARSIKGHGYYRIKKQYVPEPGVEEERYLGWYQPGGHAFDPNDGFMPISGPIHGYKTLQEAQRACEEDDETTARHLGL